MSYYTRTTKYEFEDFVRDLSCENVSVSKLKSAGFKEKNGFFKYVKKEKKVKAFIVIESERDEGCVFSLSLAVSKFLHSYHIANIGILFGNGIMIDEYLSTKNHCDIMVLHLAEIEDNFIPYDNVYLGKCSYSVSVYPDSKGLNLDEILNVAKDVGLDCSVSEEIGGEEYFSSVYDLEKKLIEFSSKTQAFDDRNNTITRVVVNDLTLPVTNNEYYVDLFSFLEKKSGKVVYNGIAGNLLDKCAGVFLVVNTNIEKNVQSLYKCIKTYVEDINGSRII